jgi:hypothetical protein
MGDGRGREGKDLRIDGEVWWRKREPWKMAAIGGE